MTTITKPVITFRSEISSDAAPEALYDVLARIPTHLVWGGEQSPHETFRLLSLDAPDRLATAGTTFRSTGENGNGTFHDSSTVIESVPGLVFAFETVSHLDRKHGRGWDVRFLHRYSLAAAAAGSRLRYTCEVRPQNYVPYWLKPGVKHLVRVTMSRWIGQNLTNLSQLAAQGARTG